MESVSNKSLPALGQNKRSFSLLLAQRYLNPRRALFSIITLICLLGVAFGVMVLVVVLSVMGGLEQEVKSRVLGLSPHIQIRFLDTETSDYSVDWRQLAERLEKNPNIEHAGAFVEDYLLLNHLGKAAPMQFNAVDPEDTGRIAELTALLDPGNGGQGHFDLGYDERVVISDRIATDFQILLGDKISVFSARNSEKALQRFQITREPLLAVRQAEVIEAIKSDLAADVQIQDETELFPKALFFSLYDWAAGLETGPLREGEKTIVTAILDILSEAELVEENATLRSLPRGSVESIGGSLDQLGELDKREEDFQVFEGLESVILPKELEVVGIYPSTSHVRIPDLFIPLNHAQELAGYDSDQVGAIALRTKDAFAAEQTRLELESQLPAGWYPITWMQQFGQWFELIARERWMMRFALGCIMLVSAFCIGAVMFTITMQKKREIGVMKALGARENQMVGVFVYQGLIIGVIGGILGVFLGWLVIVNRAPIQAAMAAMGADPFPGEFHGFDKIPAIMNVTEIGVIALMAVILCTLAAWLPAYFAARADAAKSLRNF